MTELDESDIPGSAALASPVASGPPLEVPDDALRTYRRLRAERIPDDSATDDDLREHIRCIATPVLVAEVSRLMRWLTVLDPDRFSFQAGCRMATLRQLHSASPATTPEGTTHD